MSHHFSVCKLQIDDLQVVNNDGAAVGRVQKVYSGIVKEVFTDADNFCIECQLNFFKFKIKFLLNFKYFLKVPPDLNIKSKSTLLGALFLIVIFF